MIFLKITVGLSEIQPMNFASSAKQSSFLSQNQKIQDTLTIGQEARQLFQSASQSSNAMENLMKQRQHIQEMRSNLVERTLEDNQDVSTIKEQLKELDKQILEIESEMAKEQMGKQEDAIKERDKVIENERPSSTMDHMIQSSVSLQHASSITQAKGNLEREERTLKSEIKLDAGRGIHIESKAERLSTIDERITKLNSQLAEQLKPKNPAEDVELEDGELEERENTLVAE